MSATPSDGWIGLLSPFSGVDPVVENHPNEAAQLVGAGPDGRLVAELGHPSPEHDLKMGTLLFNWGLGCLCEDSAQKWIPFGERNYGCVRHFPRGPDTAQPRRRTGRPSGTTSPALLPRRWSIALSRARIQVLRRAGLRRLHTAA
jgi:hypothetical protein